MATTTGDVTKNSTFTNVTLNAAASNKSITFTTGYTGTFDFSSYTLTVYTGNADFSSGGSIIASTSTLAFSSGTAQTFIPTSGVTFPNIMQTGAGGTTISTNSLTAGDLTLTSGTLTLCSGFSHGVKNISGCEIDQGKSSLNVTSVMTVPNLASISRTCIRSFTGTSAHTFSSFPMAAAAAMGTKILKAVKFIRYEMSILVILPLSRLELVAFTLTPKQAHKIL